MANENFLIVLNRDTATRLLNILENEPDYKPGTIHPFIERDIADELRSAIEESFVILAKQFPSSST